MGTNIKKKETPTDTIFVPCHRRFPFLPSTHTHLMMMNWGENDVNFSQEIIFPAKLGKIRNWENCDPRTTFCKKSPISLYPRDFLKAFFSTN